MLDKIRAAITVLNRGEELSHAATWKNRQNLTNILIALLGAATAFLPTTIQMSPDDIATIAGSVAVIAGLFNSYITTATTKKIGVSGEAEGRSEPTDPGP